MQQIAFYLQILKLCLKVFMIDIKVLLPVFQRIVGLLLDVVDEDVEATVVRVDAFNVRQSECLVSPGDVKEIIYVVNSA